MISILPARRAGGQVSLAVAALLAALSGPAASAPRERTTVEALVAATNPCAVLRTEFGGQAIGLDALDDVVVRSADAALVGDALTLALDGRLSCRAPSGALFQGDVSSDVSATAAVSLADCTIDELRVSLDEFGGSLGSLLEALRPTMEMRIAEAARPALVAACRDLRGE